ncbi:unnamed protein product, partial [Closterium sp. Naga37s-1]
FRESLVRLGPFYVKLGQALSTRPDILPPEYCAELALLQDRMAPFPCHVALATVQRELGVPPSELFAEFSPAPVAAASLGQVYKARLRSGEWVAVKIQRPAVQQQIALDSLVVRRVAALLQPLVHGRSDLVAIADQLVCRMFDEVDYEQEGRNAERFQALYGDHRPDPGQSKTSQGTRRGLVKVPRIFWKYSSRRVLTMEWIDGIKLTDRAGLLQAGLNTQFVVDLGVFCSLRQLLEEGFFHADPHPGNLVVTRGGQLAYFDFGMMGELPPQQRISIIRAVVHYVNRDAQGLAQDFRALHFIPPQADVAPVAAALAEAFREGEARKGGSMSGSTSGMDFQGVILRLSSVMYRFRFSLPPHLSLVVRALGSLEGTATTLDPNFKVVATAYPFIIARLLSDPSPDMRAILRQMLLWPSGAIRWQRLQRLASVLSKPSPHRSSGVDSNPPREPQEGRTEAQVAAEEEERDGARVSPKGKERAALGAEEMQGGRQRDELREGVDEAAVVAAAGDFETSQEERQEGQRGQRDELREGVDEAAVVAAAGDFLAYVMSAEGSSTRAWLVLDAVAAGQRWVDGRVGSTGELLQQRWEEGQRLGASGELSREQGVEEDVGRREARGERGGEGEVRQEGRGERGGEGGSGGSRVSGSAAGSPRGALGIAGCSSAALPRAMGAAALPHPLPTCVAHSSAPQAPLVDPLGALAAAAPPVDLLGALAAAVQRSPELLPHPTGPFGSTGSNSASRAGAVGAVTLLHPLPTCVSHSSPLQAPPLDPLGALAAAVQRAPELWVPLLVETAGRAEAREMAGRVVRGVAAHAANSAVESTLLAVSRWLHSR